MEFLSAVFDYGFLQRALLAGILAGIACGVVGTFVVSKRISYIGGGIAHSVLGGMGAAYFVRTVYKVGWINPLLGAVVAALLAAFLIGWISMRYRQREDTLISAIWAVGMAIGIIFISQTPGYYENLMSYLFGNILIISRSDLILMALLNVIVILVTVLFYNQLTAVCFDEEFARVRGVNVELFYLILMILTALTVVLLVSVVGIVMVIALLTLPTATAGIFSRSLKRTMILSALFSILFTILGLGFSYGPDLPPGAVIILIAGIFYGGASIIRSLFRRNSALSRIRN